MNIDTQAAIFATITTIVIYAIIIVITYQVIKKLIKFGIEYYFRLKNYNDGKRDIEDIEIENLKDRP